MCKKQSFLTLFCFKVHLLVWGLFHKTKPDTCTEWILWISSEINEPLDSNETLVNDSVFNLVSMNYIRFLRKLLFKKLWAFEVIHFVWNSEENKTIIFSHLLHASKNFLSIYIYIYIQKKNRYILPNRHYFLIIFMSLKTISYINISSCFVSAVEHNMKKILKTLYPIFKP